MTQLMIFSIIVGGFGLVGSFLLDGVLDLDLDFDFDFVLPIKLNFVFCFMLIFGILYYFFNNIVIGYIAIIVSLCLSGVLSYLLYKFTYKKLKSFEKQVPNLSDCIGSRGTVANTIIENGTGTVSYILNEVTLTSPAKSTTGKRINSGEKVVIVDKVNSILMVSSIDRTNKEFKF